MVVGVLMDEVGRKGTERSDGSSAGAQVVKHSAHEAISHALSAHRRFGLDVGHRQHCPIEHVVGHGDDAVVDDELIAATVRVVSNDVIHVPECAMKWPRLQGCQAVPCCLNDLC